MYFPVVNLPIFFPRTLPVYRIADALPANRRNTPAAVTPRAALVQQEMMNTIKRPIRIKITAMAYIDFTAMNQTGKKIEMHLLLSNCLKILVGLC